MHRIVPALVCLLILLPACTAPSVAPSPLTTARPATGTPPPSPLPSQTLTPTFTATLTSSPTPSASPSPTPVAPAAWRSDLPAGMYLVYQSAIQIEGSQYTTLEVISPDGAFERRLAILPLWFDPEETRYKQMGMLAVSADGSWAAYRTPADNRSMCSLVAVDLQSAKLTSIPGGICATVLVFSPDGRLLVRGNWASLEFFASPFTRSPQTIELYQPLAGFAWSPDGNHLALLLDEILTDSAYEGIYLLDAKCRSSPESCFYTARGPLYRPHEYFDRPAAFSPDGKYLAIKEGLRFGNQIYVRIINLVSGTLHQTILTSNYADGDLSSLAWSPDGSWLAYNLGAKIYLLPPYGGTPTLIKDGGGPFVGWITVP